MKELLEANVPFKQIVIANDLEQDALTQEIISLAKEHHVPIETRNMGKMEKRRSGKTREVIFGQVVIDASWTLDSLLKNIYAKDEHPFFLLVNRVDFESNIGVVARTAYAAGVNGLIFQGDDDFFINDETLHFSLGTLARIPIIKMGMFDALKQLDKNGIPTYCLEMDGEPYYKKDLTGPAAFVLGAEAKGISKEIAQRCTFRVSLPMQEGIDSLNVGVSAGVILYEKVRQDLSG